MLICSTTLFVLMSLIWCYELSTLWLKLSCQYNIKFRSCSACRFPNLTDYLNTKIEHILAASALSEIIILLISTFSTASYFLLYSQKTSGEPIYHCSFQNDSSSWCSFLFASFMDLEMNPTLYTSLRLSILLFILLNPILRPPFYPYLLQYLQSLPQEGLAPTKRKIL